MPAEEEWQTLANVIHHWNNSRLDLFEISQPSKTLDFNGVMRFYLEDRVTGDFATKCLRVGSSSTTREVIESLLEKFRPDMKRLSTPYCLYEVHGDVECKLDLKEKPLVVQLNWNTDNREGRFVLRNEEEILLEANCHEIKEKGGMIQNFRRSLSRKEKKNERNLKTTSKAQEKGSSEKEQLSSVTDNALNKKSPVSNPDPTLRHLEDRKLNQKPFNPGQVYSQSLRPSSLKSTHHGDQPETMDQLQLPMGVKFRDTDEETFLSAVINYTNSSTIHFKLSPAYVLYMSVRHVLGRQLSSPTDQHSSEQPVSSVLDMVVSLLDAVIQKQRAIAGAEAFWMANISELLNFLKQDQDLSPVTLRIQEGLAHLVHKAFKCLIHCFQVDLRKHMTAFLIDPEQQGHRPAIEGVLNTLVNAMSLVRRTRVNPALSIQLFSQLFHFVSAWLFNRLMGAEAGPLGLLSHYWGAALRQRLALLEDWAERQGLELAADCHLGRIIQATMLLTMNKYSMQDAKDIQATCFKLNSLQLKKLMSSYLYAPDEPHIPRGLIDSVVSQCQASERDLVQSEKGGVHLEESLDLQLPFLLPEGGYSCDSVRGIPHGFKEFLEPICRKGLCTLISHPHSNGMWTAFFGGPNTSSARTSSLGACSEPEVVTVTLRKPLNSGMGVSIVAAKAAGHGNLGIYVKSIVKGGPAEMDGRLAAGDQLLSVDGRSLVGLPQEKAAGIMMQTGPIVILQVAKLGACFHGLDVLLHEPPTITAMDEVHQSAGRPTAKALFLTSSQNSSELWENRRTRGHVLLKNRQLYRSNPNMTDPEESVDPVVTGGRISAVSTNNLCSDAGPREYLTLPAPRTQDKKAPAEYEKPRQTSRVSFSPLGEQIQDTRVSMRHARSQDNLYMKVGAPLVDKRERIHQDQGRRHIGHDSSFSVGSSVSTHDLHYQDPPSAKQQTKCLSGSGYWRTPALQKTRTSLQPIRIDIPVTKPVHTHVPLTTFQQKTNFLAVKANQTPKSNEQTLPGNQRPGYQPLADHHPSSAANRLPLPTLSSPLQHQLSPHKKMVKLQIILPSSRQISPHKAPPSQQQPIQKDLNAHVAQEVSDIHGPSPDPRKDGQGLSPDPWKRDAREKVEKQQRLQAVDLLEQEVQELRAKTHPTPEESHRLRRLTLECQFQKRLQEFQQSRNDDEEEEDDEDMDVMKIMQQLEVENRMRDKEYIKRQQHDGSTNQEEENILGNDQGSTHHDQPDLQSKLEQRENMRSRKEPEKLPFRERQRLFSLDSTMANIQAL